MVAYKARTRVRQLYQSGMNSKQVQQATGYASWIIDGVIRQIEEAKAKSRQAMIEYRERQKQGQIVNPIVKKHGKRIPPQPVKCSRCRVLVKELSDRYQLAICLECESKDLKQKAMTRRRLGIVASLLLLLAGCQAPREFKAEAKIAGQTLNVQVMR